MSVWGQVCGIMDAGAHIGGEQALLLSFSSLRTGLGLFH